MRNYTQLFAGIIYYNAPGNPPPDFPLASIQENQEDLDADMILAAQDIVAAGNEVRSQNTQPVYVLLDKYNLVNLLRAYFTGFLDNPANNGFDWFKTQTGLIFQDTGTPRDGWTDGEGEVMKPPPSEKSAKQRAKANFSGAPALLAFAASLVDTASKLIKAGFVREAGIVLYAYQQIKNNTFSITQAITYLRKNLPAIFS